MTTDIVPINSLPFNSSRRPDVDVKEFARSLAVLMDAECIELEATRGTQAILRFPALKIELLLSGKKKITIYSQTIEGDHYIYGPTYIDPARSLESIGRSLTRNKNLFDFDRVAEAEARDAKLNAIVEEFRRTYPYLLLNFDGRDVNFSYTGDGLSIQGTFFPSVPGCYGYNGSPFGRLRITHMAWSGSEIDFERLMKVLPFITPAGKPGKS
jgi:hypothetical protein